MTILLLGRLLAVLCFWVTVKSATFADSGWSSYIPELSGVGTQLVAALPVVSFSPASNVTAIAYRLENGRLDEVTLVCLPRPVAPSILNGPDPLLRDVRDVLDDWGELIQQPITIHAAPNISRSYQRAWTRAIAGDLGLLRELTIDPLHMVVIILEPDPYLPPSLRGKVRAMILTLSLKLTAWDGSVHFVEQDPGDAARVASTIAAWQELLGTLVDGGKGELPAQWQHIARSVQMETNATAAVLTLSIPAPLLQRVARMISAPYLLGQ